MNRAATHLHTVLERLPLRIKPGKRRQQTRMNVQYPPPKRLNKTRRQQPHVSREANKIYLPLAQRRDDLALVFLAITPATLNRNRLDSPLSRQCQSRRGGLVADHDRDLSIRYCPIANGIAEREHV